MCQRNGGGPTGFVIEKAVQKGNLTYVICDFISGWHYKDFYVVEPKTIGESTYWTLHYAASVRSGETPNLPEGFDYEAPVLSPDIVDCGACGEKLSWTLDKDGLLTISGEGIMELCFCNFSAKNVVISEGMTNLCVQAFIDCRDLNSITIPQSVTNISGWAFSYCNNLTDVYYNGTKEQWQKISIGEENEPLLNATIHFAEQSETPDPTPTPTPAPDPTPTPTPTPTPAPTGLVTKTDTAADGTVTSTTTWPDGKTSVKTQTPQGDTKLVVTNSTGATVVNISIPGNPGPAKQFTDVQSGWYKESVDKAAALGLFSGTGDNTFSPNEPMTRGMLATVLHRLSGEVGYGLGTGNFPDVANGTWYKDAVDWAQATGVVTGTGNGFEPNTDVTRGQLVTMLYRYAQLIGADDEKSVNIAGFADAGSVSGYAQDAMCWAVAEGLVSGVGDNRLDPAGKATRAQVAAILTRFTDYLQR